MKHTIQWTELPSGVYPTMNESFGITGQVTGIGMQTLPSGYQRMAGLQTALWSGYAGDTRISANVTGVGEMVLIRIDGPVSKSYAYPIGKSGEQYYIGKEFKSFDAHHADVNYPAAPDQLFGNIRWPLMNGNLAGSGIAPASSGSPPVS